MSKNNAISAIVSALVALAVGLAVLFGFHPTAAPVTPVRSAGINTNIDRYSNGLGIGSKQVMFVQDLSLPAGTTSVAWQNKTGRTVYLDLSEVTTTGTASSSFLVYMGTSSAPTFASDFSAPWASFIDGFPLATSSLATTTSNYDKSKTGSKILPVADRGYVVLQLQANKAAVTGCSGAVGLCEAATSTNRGFNLTAIIKGFYNQP